MAVLTCLLFLKFRLVPNGNTMFVKSVSNHSYHQSASIVDDISESIVQTI